MKTNIPTCKNLATIGEYLKCKNEIITRFRNEPFYLESSLIILSKHFLAKFLDLDIWTATVFDVQKEYSLKFEDADFPTNGKDFYEYIAKEYLDLLKAPKDRIIELQQKSIFDISEIRKTIQKLDNTLKDLKNKSNRESFLDVEDRYTIKHIEYYIAKNKQAIEDILKFLSEDLIEVALQDCKVKEQNGLGLSSFLGMGNKYYPYHNIKNTFLSFVNIYDIEDYSDLNNKLMNLELAKHKNLRALLKENEKEIVLDELKHYLKEHKVKESIVEFIKHNHILDSRKEILNKILEHYENKDFISVNNMLPLQIEGLFHDFCLLVGIKEKELNISSLNTKLDLLKENNSEMRLYNYEYFSFRFPIIRNKVAHGRYIDANDEFQSVYLIYDLLIVCEMITNSHIELNMMLDIIDKIDLLEENFEYRFGLIRFLDKDIPSFYTNKKAKFESIKKQYLEDVFLLQLDKFIEDDNNFKYLESVLKNLSILKTIIFPCGDKTLDKYFKKVNLKIKRKEKLNNIIIKKLTEMDEKYYENLFEMDSELVNKYGASFSNETWNIENFKYQLPGKEEFSYVCFFNSEIIGYIIVSLKKESIYIHRFAVRKKGYARIFFEEILKYYNGLEIFLMVNTLNNKAINFYKDFNFVIVNDNLIINKFIADGLEIVNNEILVGENYKCYLMKRN